MKKNFRPHLMILIASAIQSDQAKPSQSASLAKQWKAMELGKDMEHDLHLPSETIESAFKRPSNTAQDPVLQKILHFNSMHEKVAGLVEYFNGTRAGTENHYGAIRAIARTMYSSKKFLEKKDVSYLKQLSTHPSNDKNTLIDYIMKMRKELKPLVHA
ncbi:MAG: hypothetical protein JWM20_974 [Patescibacteria group bacterium]|nr:hypothetical protein [Patescibacteria group bacterium]